MRAKSDGRECGRGDRVFAGGPGPGRDGRAGRERSGREGEGEVASGLTQLYSSDAKRVSSWQVRGSPMPKDQGGAPNQVICCRAELAEALPYLGRVVHQHGSSSRLLEIVLEGLHSRPAAQPRDPGDVGTVLEEVGGRGAPEDDGRDARESPGRERRRVRKMKSQRRLKDAFPAP